MNKEQENIPGKKIEPLPDLPGELEPLEVNPAEGEEQDLDDLVHSIPPETIPGDSEADPDDLVHQQPVKLPEESLKEKDPDDLVHGND